MILRAMLAVAYATGRVSHTRQVKGDDPDKKGYPGPPGWEFSVGLTIPHSKKLIVTKVEQRVLFDRPTPTAGCSANGRSFVILDSCVYFMYLLNDSHWPRGLKRRSAAARPLRSWVRIPPGHGFVCCECCVLSGRGHCDELITSPEESYRLWCVL
jgi:hypothetical protein